MAAASDGGGICTKIAIQILCATRAKKNKLTAEFNQTDLTFEESIKNNPKIFVKCIKPLHQ